MKSIVHFQPPVPLPAFSGIQLYMQKATLASLSLNVPKVYEDTIKMMLKDAQIPQYLPVYVTIDEREVQAGETHRRGGAHIDGNWVESLHAYAVPRWNDPVPEPSWDTAPRWGYRQPTGGLLLTSNVHGSHAWRGELKGHAGDGGDCEHLREQLDQLPRIDLTPGYVYLLNSTCVHECIPMPETTHRQVLRITLHESFEVH